MKKLILIIAALCLFFALSVPAFAAEDPLTETGPQIQVETETAEVQTNPLAELYAWISEQSGKIFSILAALGSIGVVFLFRRGMIPLLTDAIRALTGIAGKIRESSENTGEENRKTLGSVNSSLQSVVELLENVKDDMTAFADRIDSLEKENGQRQMLSTVLLSQVDMLADVFLSSSLPQYRKEEIGERILAMRQAIGALTEKDE